MTDQGSPGKYSGPEYARLLAPARRSLERTGGDLGATITVQHPEDPERKAIIGITGQYRAEGSAQIGVRIADLDRAVREATGTGLVDLLERSHRRSRTARRIGDGWRTDAKQRSVRPKIAF